MKTCHYNAIAVDLKTLTINTGSLASDEYPLIVNCAGRYTATTPFVTDNVGGRKDFYLIYIEHGKLEVTLDGYTHIAQSGSTLIFPPQFHYRYAFSGNDALSYLWVHFTGSYVERFLDECGFGKLPHMHHSDSNIKIISGFEKLFNIFNAREPLQKHKLACQLEHICLRIASDRNDVSNAYKITKSLEYIHTFYNKELKIPDLAKMEALSNSRYITVFKNNTGMTPSEYIIQLRISVACDLLENLNISVKAVAASVGYDNPHFFSKIFKKKMGVSPKSYREGRL